MHWAIGLVLQDKEPDDDDGGSDSNPSADEKPAAELRKIQRRLATKAKRQKTFRIEPEEVEEEAGPVDVLPVGGRGTLRGDKMEGGLSRRNSQVDDAAEKFMRVARRHSVQGGEISPASPGLDHSPCDWDTPANSGRHADALRPPSKSRVSAFLDVTTSSGCASPRSPSSPVSPLRRRSLRPKSKESCEPTEISFHLPPEPPELEAEAHEALEGPGEPGPAATEQSPVSLGAASPVSEPGLSGAGPDGVAAAAGGAASEPKIDELSPHSESGSRLSSRRLSSRHRRDVGPTQELGPILYSPGCPPPASSHAGGSCIQLELSTDVGAQAMERRLSSLQAVALSFSRQVSPVVVDDSWQTSVPASPDLRARPQQRVLIGHAPSSFQDWVGQHKSVEHAHPVCSPRQLWVERRALKAPRPASMHSVRKHLSKGKQVSEPGPECGQRREDSRKLIADQSCKPKAPSRVTVHFRNAAPPQRRTTGSVAKVTPGSAAMKPPSGAPAPQGPRLEHGTLRLQPANAGGDFCSPLCSRKAWRADSEHFSLGGFGSGFPSAKGVQQFAEWRLGTNGE
eukprot:s1250_g9.t1